MSSIDAVSHILEKLGITEENKSYLPFLKEGIENLKNFGVIKEEDYFEIKKIIAETVPPKSLSGYKTKYPIFYFNLSTQNLKYYKKWGWEISCILYEIQNDPVRGNMDKIYNYALNLIKFFKIIKELESKGISFEYKNFYDLKRLNIESFKDLLLEKELVIIKKILTFIKKDFKKNYGKISSHAIAGDKYKYYEKKFVSDNDEFPYRTKIIKSVPKSQDLEIDEETIYFIDQEPQIPSKKDHLNKYYKKISILKSNIHLITSQNSITLNEVLFIYKEFYNLLNSHNDKKDYFIFLALAILSLNTGISITELKNVFLKQHNLAKISETENNILFYFYKNPLKAHFKHKKILQDLVYNAKDKIKIFFPPDLQIVASTIKENKKVLKKSSFSKELSKLNKKYPYSFRFTEKRIQNFFFNYYIDKYALDALFAEYISLMNDQFSYSQQHYTTIKLFDLNKKFFTSYKMLQKDLKFTLKSKIPEKSILEKINKDEYIGSFIVLKKENIQNFFKEIHSYLLNNKLSNVEIFNLKNIYLYFLIQLTTGHRPVTEPEYNEKNYYFSENFTILIIRDKSAMPRAMPLCRFLFEQLEQHQKFCSKIITNYKLQAKVTTIFFLIKRKNNFYIEDNNFSKKNLEELFFKNLCQQYSYLPSNFMRHYFRTYLTNKNLDSKFIDWLMGHYVLGQEMLNKFSTMNIAKFRRQTLEIQEKIIEEHGISPIY